MSKDRLSSFSHYAAQQELLRERLHLILATLHPLLRSDVQQALEEKGKLLYQPDKSISLALPTGNWALLPLLIAQYVNPFIDDAVVSSVGVAIECFVCALDLLDDVEDEDQTPVVQKLGVARTLNVSTTLLMLAQQALLSLAQQNIPSDRVLFLLDTLQTSTLHATAGQHRDLLAEQRPAEDMTDEECIEIAAGKAGAIMRLACLMGALVADADKILCVQFSEMGELLGIAHQLDNDSHDLYYLLQGQTSTEDAVHPGTVTESVKSDLARGKKTLPVVLAAHSERILQENAAGADEDSEEHKAALQEGIITTWGICLLYRDRAHDCFQKIEAQKPVASPLRILLGFE
ncbi:MAG TPA: polyprenyl synthetase family protein [Ktedonobacteraceae bacterium]|nr:polyprenyl synthetase family protein [Ktedonobacteraceae bacterium]